MPLSQNRRSRGLGERFCHNIAEILQQPDSCATYPFFKPMQARQEASVALGYLSEHVRPYPSLWC